MQSRLPLPILLLLACNPTPPADPAELLTRPTLECSDPSDWCQDCDSVCEGVCGDGIAQPWETCDDGNLDEPDDCNRDCNVSGQPRFVLELPTEQVAQFEWFDRAPDGNIVVLSANEETPTMSRVTKYSLDGTVLWTTPIVQREAYPTTRLAVNDDGVTMVITSDGDKETMLDLAIIDSDGAIVWQDLVDDEFYQLAIAVKATRAGTFVLAGSRGAGTGRAVWLRSYRADGSLEWETSERARDAFAFAVGADDSLALIGSDSEEEEIVTWRFSSQGKTQWAAGTFAEDAELHRPYCNRRP